MKKCINLLVISMLMLTYLMPSSFFITAEAAPSYSVEDYESYTGNGRGSRTLGEWSYSFLNENNQTVEYSDILITDWGDSKKLVLSNYETMESYMKIEKSNGASFSLVSFNFESGPMTSDYTVIGYKDNTQIIEHDFYINYTPNQMVQFNDEKWSNIDEFRIKTNDEFNHYGYFELIIDNLTTAPVMLSDNANLSGLTTSEGMLSTNFDSNTLSYTIDVENEITSIDLTGTVADSNSTITIDGVEVVNGTAHKVDELNVGSNLIPITVTAQDGTRKTYSVSVTRAGSSNANLSDLKVSAGDLSPAFDVNQTNYTLELQNDSTSVDLTGTLADLNGSMKVDGVEVASGISFTIQDLAVGTKNVSVEVTAQDGTVKTYSVVITRLGSSNANLSDLTVSEGDLSPSFDSENTDYTAEVGNDISSIDVTGIVADLNASITVNDVDVNSGSPYTISELKVGSNNSSVKVTAQDGSIKTYTINVIRAGSSNNNLADLAISEGELSPSFEEKVTNYTVKVGNKTSSIVVTGAVADTNGSMTINGVDVDSGTPFTMDNLNVGSNLVSIKVTAEDGTVQTYEISVERAASSNADLNHISLSEGTLSPLFNPNTTSYTTTVAHKVTSIDLIGILAGQHSSMTINGTLAVNGEAYTADELKVGSNSLLIEITAQDGSIKHYNVNVERLASSNADLSELTLSKGTLSPAFDVKETEYKVEVAHEVTALELSPTSSDHNSSIEINGDIVASNDVYSISELKVGDNPITIKVTAQDGTVKIYEVMINRAASSNADLADLDVSEGALSSDFDPSKTSYTVDVSNGVNEIDITAIKADKESTFTIEGEAVESGNPYTVSKLVVGDNTVKVEVTAQDGTVKTYNVSINRAASSNADLSNISLSKGSLSPAFTSDTTSYTVNVANSVKNIDVTGSLADEHSSMKINEILAENEVAETITDLKVGINKVTIEIIAQDGTEKAYEILIERAASSNAKLADLQLSEGAFEKDFDPEAKSHTVNVAHAVTSLHVTASLQDEKSAMTINGTTVKSGSAYSVKDLKVGKNKLIFEITAEDESVNTYEVVINRAASSNADLAGLKVSEGVLSPSFDSDVTSYRVDVKNAVKSLEIAGLLAGSNSSMQINGKAVASASSYSIGDLVVGKNKVTLKITAQDKTVKNYELIINRSASSNANLIELVDSEGKLTSLFQSDKTVYDIRVGHDVESIKLKARTEVKTANVTIAGKAIKSNDFSEAITLTAGEENKIKTVVTAEDGSKKTYILNVTRLVKKKNSTVTVKDDTVLVKDSDIDQLDKEGVLVVDLPEEVDAVEAISFDNNQIQYLKENNIQVEINKSDVGLVIPAANFKGSEPITVTLTPVSNGVTTLPAEDLSIGSVYDFTIKQGEEVLSTFDYDIEMLFPVDKNIENPNELRVYYLNEVTNEWELIGGNYVDGFMKATTSHFSTFGVFHPSAFAVSDEDTNSDAPVEEVDNSEEITEETVTPEVEKEVEEEQQTQQEEKEDAKEESELPNTATNMFNLLTIGFILVLCGGIVYLSYVRKQKLNN